MKVPTVGTSVFAPVSTSGNVASITSGFPVDFALGKEVKNSTGYGNNAIDRLRGFIGLHWIVVIIGPFPNS
jgi:hypothetical protein